MEFERVRREKLEVQLDNCRQELEKSMKSIHDYENKVLVLEKFLQHTAKEELKTKKKQHQATGGRQPSPTKINRSRSANKDTKPTVKSTTTKRKTSASKTASEKTNYHRRDILDVIIGQNIILSMASIKLCFMIFL